MDWNVRRWNPDIYLWGRDMRGRDIGRCDVNVRDFGSWDFCCGGLWSVNVNICLWSVDVNICLRSYDPFVRDFERSVFHSSSGIEVESMLGINGRMNLVYGVV